MPAANLTLYAEWLRTLSFDTNSATPINSINLRPGDALSAPSEPTKIGYTFAGWYTNVALTIPFTFGSMPDENLIVYAKWTINQYTITFNSNGGTELAPITQDYDTTVVEPLEPTRVGYTFSGWYEDQTLVTEYIFTSMPASDITVYAKWTRSITYILYDEVLKIVSYDSGR